jgi:hypothetical protein
MKIGDITRITEWDGDVVEPAGWAIVTENAQYHDDEPFVCCVIGGGPTTSPWYDGTWLSRWGDSKGWIPESHMDIWEVVPEDQVPDEVWAMLAKWRLEQ